ncbi:MAG: penicillin-binding protein [Nocardioides sp.]|nr:penicillin-binding protein [Nocardioides sp.]
MRRTLVASLALPLLTMSLVACSDSQDKAEEAAGDLAAALESKSLDEVRFQGEKPDQYDDLIADLEDLPVTVEVSGVDTKDSTATATLDWTWDVAGHEWTYEATAELVEDGDDWLVTWAPSIIEPSLKDGETLEVDTLLPKRGDIRGAKGVALVTERDVVRYGIDKSKVKQPVAVASASKVARALDIEVATYVMQVKAAGDKAFVEALVLRAGEARTTVPGSYSSIPGAVALGSRIPLAPSKEFAAPILGSVGAATAEMIKKSDGALENGDIVGLSGLQARFEEQLAGTSGVQVEAVDQDGNEREIFSADEVNGEPLELTLDPRLQTKAEDILADVGPASSIVAIAPSTGKIVAAASGPGANGNNIATYGQYAPGSTFKVVSALALLRSGLTPESMVTCEPTVVVDGKTFKNYDGYPSSSLGRITLREAVAQSCNTGIISQVDKLSDAELADAAAALGLGVDHDLGFPAYFGQVPAPASETEKAADLIGQGKVLASPMAMATVSASVRAGKTVLPKLIVGHEVEQVKPDKPLTGKETGQLRGLMRDVVTQGSGSFLQDLPGEIGAKTGTAEYGSPDANGDLATHTWMIAWRDDLAVAVFVEKGESGSGTSGPLLHAFLAGG